MNRIIPFLFILFLQAPIWAVDNPPFTLEKAIELGLKNNLSLDFANRETRIGIKNMRMMYRKFFPELNVGFATTDTVEYNSPDNHVRQISAGLTQLIYDKGVLHSSIKLEKERLRIEEQQNILDRDRYIFSIIDGYKNILELEKELEITEQAKLVVEQQVQIGSLERDLGEITQFDFLELELALSDMEIKRAKIVQQLNDARADFASIINISIEEVPTLKGILNYEYCGFVNKASQYYVNEAMTNSIEMKEMIFKNHQAKSNYKILKKNYLPDISVSCNFSISDEKYPLTEKSFSVFLNLKFDTPGLPGNIKSGIGKNSEDQRSRNFSSNAEILGNSEELFSRQSGKIAKEKAEWDLENLKREYQNLIIEKLQKIQILKENLDVSRKRIELEKTKVAIEETKVNLGEEKRIDYIESQISLMQDTIKIYQYISELYSEEIALMNICGIGVAETTGSLLIQENDL